MAEVRAEVRRWDDGLRGADRALYFGDLLLYGLKSGLPLLEAAVLAWAASTAAAASWAGAGVSWMLVRLRDTTSTRSAEQQ